MTEEWKMRLPIIPPKDLDTEQRPLYDDMKQGIAANFQGFINIRQDGALLARGIPGCTIRNSESRSGN